MTRPLRIEFAGAVYYITSRGNAKQAIFLDEKDFADFLGVLGLVVKRYHFILHAYCLMNNHYHLLMETPDGNLSRGMRQLNGLYTQRFNKKHQRVGPLLQGRYQAILVDKDHYLLTLCRYVVLNPVRAKIVKDPGDWKWSTYRATIGDDPVIPCLTTDWILSQFSQEQKKASSLYQVFVRSGIKAESPLKAIKGQLFLGQENFIEEIKHLMRGKEKLKEITRPALKEIFKGKDKKSKDQVMYEAHLQYGYTLKDIAEYIGVHYTTVSRAIKKD
jgi:putative transposase